MQARSTHFTDSITKWKVISMKHQKLSRSLVALFALIAFLIATESRSITGPYPSEGQRRNAFVTQTTPASASGFGRTYTGMSDGSAAIALDENTFVVASDERNTSNENRLGIYRANQDGAQVNSISLGAALIPDPDKEADIEGAARIGKRVYWIASHGRDKEGKLKPARHRFFATEIEGQGGEIKVRLAGTAGPFKAYTKLLGDMLNDPKLAALELKALNEKPLAPEKGGINIEGLSATRDNKLLIGFRSPLRAGKALLVPLENPDALVEEKEGVVAIFGAPVELDLEGLGVRDMQYWKEKDIYLILAGSVDAGGVFKLFTWTGKPDQKPELIKGAAGKSLDLSCFNPEAIVTYPNSNVFQLLSDDGDMLIRSKQGKTTENKKLPDAERLFRSLWLSWS
jgi:hypothetical protein